MELQSQVRPSLKPGWVTFKDAIELFGATNKTLLSWRKKHAECFDVINPKSVNVNVLMLNAKVNRLTQTQLNKFKEVHNV